MKPNPHLLTVALREAAASPSEVVLIGDSTTDIEAAHAAGTVSIAYANRSRFEPLHPTAIVTAMSDRDLGKPIAWVLLLACFLVNANGLTNA